MKVEYKLLEILENGNCDQEAILNVTKFILASIFDTSTIDVQDLAETILDKETKQ